MFSIIIVKLMFCNADVALVSPTYANNHITPKDD